MSDAPYRATIELDLWVWDRTAAFEVLGQLLSEIENITTDDGGAIGTNHRIITSTLTEDRGHPTA